MVIIFSFYFIFVKDENIALEIFFL